ncbi:hypothetical protein DTO164E3_2008 [Paecilomyces variotii]|nr:hypothetical protein DTO164E3_2008 [Paecilomyces variotii]KAJ9221726.1 hypothetical protein DTO169C6_5872 [Paecilomyces variotii]KAJ9267911.1 hypothetical protein DTO195F2_245 [Paecilomyces variotii]KAJ9283500.1 hypothetical protein DTO021C3_8910 [Paecilomyces variotii]KAJ9308692.1 hypothetical protein DTO217A2_1934 [Paecilomyces variotii]
MSNESDEKVVIVRGHSLSIRQREASAVVAIFFSGGTSDPEGKKTSQERNGWRLVDHTAEMLLQKNPPATNANADRRAGRAPSCRVARLIAIAYAPFPPADASVNRRELPVREKKK